MIAVKEPPEVRSVGSRVKLRNCREKKKNAARSIRTAVRRALVQRGSFEAKRHRRSMTPDQLEPTPDLARWLQEAGRRRIPRVLETRPEPDGQVLAHLEHLTGRELRSREAIVRFLEDLAADEAKRARNLARRRAWREGALLLLLTAAYLHYDHWDVKLKIALLPEMKVFVPIQDRDKGLKRAREKA